MNSDYDDIIVDIAALLALLYVAFRANGATDAAGPLLTGAAFLLALYFVINIVAGAWQGWHRER